MPSMMKRFSPALAPSIERPPSLADSLLAPGACVTSDVKSRPLGSRSICSLRMLVLRALCLTSTSGDSAVTWTLSATPATASVKSTFLIWPSDSGTSGVLAVLNPASVAVTSQIPDASDGNRYTPFASVTADTTTPVDFVLGLDGDARHHGAGGVPDDALDRRALLLCERRHRQREHQERERDVPKTHILSSSLNDHRHLVQAHGREGRCPTCTRPSISTRGANRRVFVKSLTSVNLPPLVSHGWRLNPPTWTARDPNQWIPGRMAAVWSNDQTCRFRRRAAARSLGTGGGVRLVNRCSQSRNGGPLACSPRRQSAPWLPISSCPASSSPRPAA